MLVWMITTHPTPVCVHLVFPSLSASHWKLRSEVWPSERCSLIPVSGSGSNREICHSRRKSQLSKVFSVFITRGSGSDCHVTAQFITNIFPKEPFSFLPLTFPHSSTFLPFLIWPRHPDPTWGGFSPSPPRHSWRRSCHEARWRTPDWPGPRPSPRWGGHHHLRCDMREHWWGASANKKEED